MALVHEGTQRHTHRNDGGTCARRCNAKHDHDLVFGRRDRVAACQNLARHHAWDGDKAGDAEHVDERRQRRAENLLERRPAHNCSLIMDAIVLDAAMSSLSAVHR
jgi:hypothetical protein